jgi:RNA polymerase sigma-70 factor (ECF subfamily)
VVDFLDELEDCVPALRRYARALTRNIDRADDLVQDCLERAISRRGLFRPGGPLRPCIAMPGAASAAAATRWI